MNSYIFSRNENAMWTCIFIMCLITKYMNPNFLQLLIFWLLIIIVNGNAKRVYSNKYIKLSFAIRRSLYVIPLFLPLAIFKVDIIASRLFTDIFIGIIIGLIFLSPKVNEWKLLLNNEFIALSSKRHKISYFSETLMLLLGAIGEEIFFRAYIIGQINNGNGLLAITTSTCLFFLHHFGLKWGNEFTFYDYIIEISFGLVSSLIYLYTGSIIITVFMHIIYNTPHVLISVKEYKFHYIRTKGDIKWKK